MLAARSSLGPNEVPTIAFWLVTLAPIALLPFLTPFMSRQHAWYIRVLRALLVLAPLIVAVVLAEQHETIAGHKDWE
jgi:hypothetical protein